MNSKTSSLHCLVELSRIEAKVLQNNIITLGGLSYESRSKKAPKISSYEDIKFGKGMHLIERSSLINGERMKRSEINLCKMKNRVVFVTVHKTEILTASNQNVVVDTSFRTNSDT